MFLQKASEAKRSYGTLLSVNSVQFGENPEHISEHDGIHFKSLLSDCYKKANVDPASVEYVEAYGSGIEVSKKKKTKSFILLELGEFLDEHDVI